MTYAMITEMNAYGNKTEIGIRFGNSKNFSGLLQLGEGRSKSDWAMHIRIVPILDEDVIVQAIYPQCIFRLQ
jgi:hypothetical protein